MLANKIKEQMEMQEKEALEQKKSEDQIELEKKLSDIETLLSGLKEDIQFLSDGTNKIVKKNDKYIFINSTKENKFHKENRFESSSAFKSFFLVYKEIIPSETLELFKEWLEENAINDILVEHENDGGGHSTWVNFYLEI